MAEGPPESVTRGFLFADLRGYTDFVERHGASAAASLLTRYRGLARQAIGRFGGAEIKTEGDSFYVVFSSVSSAVRCGLALTADARAATAEHPNVPIRVGVGIHAGETVELEDGYVGSAVNIAARICSQAGAGEVVVSETVRALTRTVLPVGFKSRGRRDLKGIAEPIELFAVVEAADGTAWADAPRRRISRRTRFALIGAGALALFAVIGVGAWALRGSTELPPGQWTIALEAPLSGVIGPEGVALRNAVQLALDEANVAGVLEGVELVLEPYDDAGLGEELLPDPDLGAENATAMVDDPRTIAIVGPYNSEIAQAQVPITNEAGLLECAPSTTHPGLTKPDYGALELRPEQPDRINFVRLSPSDDNQLRGLAAYATNSLEAESALVINDEPNFPLWADGFSQAFTDLGGRVIPSTYDHASRDRSAALAPLMSGDGADVVFYAGFDADSAAALRRYMVDAEFETTPFLSGDSLLGGSGADVDSYLYQAGEAANGSYASHSSLGPVRASFIDDYRAAYGEEPNEYTAAAYACAEVIIQSLRAIAESGPSEETLRETLRAHAVDPSHRFETILGIVGFDSNGDSIQQFVEMSRVDPAGADGAGDWVVIEERDYGPAPD
jgi:branched-chain amino acid transport system substrate-binding protein